MKVPKVTILMPSLNVVNYIDQCIGSVVKQSLKDIEILCIDAGSTDGTLEILKKYAAKDKRVRIINSEIKSYGYQMNLGIKEAKGEFIGIVETDDYACKNMYSALYKMAKKNNADIVYSDYYEVRGCNKLGMKKGQFDDFEIKDGIVSEDIKKKILFKTAGIWRALYNTAFLKNNNIWFLESKGASFQDTSFFHKCLISPSKVAVTKKAYYRYRLDNEGSSVHSNSKVFCVCDELNSSFEYLYKSKNNTEDYVRLLWRRKYDIYIWNLTRLNREGAESFISNMVEEFSTEEFDEILKCSYFDSCRDEIRLLIKDPKKYLISTNYVSASELVKDETDIEVRNLLIDRIVEERDGNSKMLDRMIDDMFVMKNSVAYKIGSAAVFLPKKIVKIFK